MLALAGLDPGLMFILIVAALVVEFIACCTAGTNDFDHFCSLCGERIGKSGEQFVFYIRKDDLK